MSRHDCTCAQLESKITQLLAELDEAVKLLRDQLALNKTCNCETCYASYAFLAKHTKDTHE